MRILRAADHKRMPWKNGGGVTTEIAVHPDGAGLDSFEWRLSMATVSADGPFSIFAGIERTLAVLEGEGIVLSVAGMADATLTRTSPPLAFPADSQASARLIDGPIQDFNVMTRRGRIAHTVERVAAGRKSVSVDGAQMVAILCGQGSATIASDGTYHGLGPQDAVILREESCALAPHADADVYLVRLTELS
jgi:hypothetical protein